MSNGLGAARSLSSKSTRACTHAHSPAQPTCLCMHAYATRAYLPVRARGSHSYACVPARMAAQVQRQLSALKAAISQDGLQIEKYGGYSLLQYNPPYTLPWLRRNEIAVRGRQAGSRLRVLR